MAFMGTKLYVGNMSMELSEQELRSLFEEGGRRVVEVSIITDRYTGKPRGFGFVQMGSAEDAVAAIEALNGREVSGRALAVSEARERTDNRSGGGPRRGGGGFGRRGR